MKTHEWIFDVDVDGTIWIAALNSPKDVMGALADLHRELQNEVTEKWVEGRDQLGRLKKECRRSVVTRLPPWAYRVVNARARAISYPELAQLKTPDARVHPGSSKGWPKGLKRWEKKAEEASIAS